MRKLQEADQPVESVGTDEKAISRNRRPKAIRKVDQQMKVVTAAMLIRTLGLGHLPELIFRV
jgi:hypothetical protein